MEIYIIMRANGTLVAAVTDIQHYAEKNGYEMPDETGEMRKIMPKPEAGKANCRLPSVYMGAQATVDHYRNFK